MTNRDATPNKEGQDATGHGSPLILDNPLILRNAGLDMSYAARVAAIDSLYVARCFESALGVLVGMDTT